MKPECGIRVLKTLSLLCACWLISEVHAGELLGHISDDTEPVAAPAMEPNNDRRIIYRVICAPDGEALPDCERPFTDREAVQAPIPADETPIDDIADDRKAEVSATEKTAKTPVKKTKSTKKTAKQKTKSKTSSKKSAKKPKKTKSGGH